MALNTIDYIKKIFERENQKNNPIRLSRENINQIKNSATVNSTDRKSQPLPVSFYTSTSIAPTGSIASLRFDVVSKDIFQNDTRIIGYEIYRSDASDETELSVDNVYLVASIDSSRIQGSSYTFEDKTATSSIYYYAIVAIDSNGRSSEPNFQKYVANYGTINDIAFSSYNILPDKSIDLNFSIVYVSDGIIPEQREDEYNDFLDFLDFIEFRNGADWSSGDTILKTKQLSYNFKPNVLSDTYYIKAKHLFGNYSENALSLSIGSGQTVDWTIGSLDSSSSSATEDFYTSKDGTVNSRIKLNLASVGGDDPAKILVKIRKSGEASFSNALEIDYDTTIYLENGAESLEIGKEYFIEVYPKTEWGLIGTKIDLSVTLSGKNVPPTPVFFTDNIGTPITSKTFEREFDLNWEFSVDADDDTYELRYGNTSSTWETATFLWQGRAEKYIWQPAGTVLTSNVVRVWIKSRNRSGLYQTTASYIDCTNNAPSTPNIPTIAKSDTSMMVSWVEKTTVSDKDIEYYIVQVNEDGTDIETIKVFTNFVDYSVEFGKLYKFKVKAVDIYGQESSYSSYSTAESIVLKITENSITLYPSGDMTGVTDKANVNSAISSISNGGNIIFAVGEFYFNFTSPIQFSKPIFFSSETFGGTIINTVAGNGSGFGFQGLAGSDGSSFDGFLLKNADLVLVIFGSNVADNYSFSNIESMDATSSVFKGGVWGGDYSSYSKIKGLSQVGINLSDYCFYDNISDVYNVVSGDFARVFGCNGSVTTYATIQTGLSSTINGCRFYIISTGEASLVTGCIANTIYQEGSSSAINNKCLAISQKVNCIADGNQCSSIEQVETTLTSGWAIANNNSCRRINQSNITNLTCCGNTFDDSGSATNGIYQVGQIINCSNNTFEKFGASTYSIDIHGIEVAFNGNIVRNCFIKCEKLSSSGCQTLNGNFIVESEDDIFSLATISSVICYSGTLVFQKGTGTSDGYVLVNGAIIDVEYVSSWSGNIIDRIII